MASSMMGAILTHLAVAGVLILAVALVLIRVMRAGGNAATAVKSMADPVPGTLLVTAAAMPDRGSAYHMTRITGILSADGVEPRAVQFGGLVKTSLWPSPGQQLPVVVDRADPSKFAILWDEVRGGGDAALDQAEALAAAMRARQEGDRSG
ncbi:MAG: hypothetical protein QOD42_1050 [Sphingomonadales bacterium]|jgi:hypothetical protein|nr:hypothetical protein [Sphingomonadales bacterium]